MKKFISAICVIALMMPSTLSAFADDEHFEGFSQSDGSSRLTD